MSRSAIGFGGNQGDVSATLSQVLQRLGVLKGVDTVRASPLYRTAPVGRHAGGTFLNAVLLVEMTFPPEEWLERLQDLERDLGRRRDVPWGPRPLDLDVLSYDDRVIASAHLLVPHPLCWCRPFVLDPWCDVDPDWRHPQLQTTVRQMRDRLQQRPLRVGIRRAESAPSLASLLQEDFEASDVRWLTEGSVDDPDLGFDLTGRSAEGRWLSVRHEEDVDWAREILRGALDRPKPLDSEA